MLTLRRLLSRRFQIVKKYTIFSLLRVFPLLIFNFVFVASNYFIILHIFLADLEIKTWVSFIHIEKWITLHQVMQ